MDSMTETPPPLSNPWLTGQKSGLVSIGPHSLHLQAAGPDRKSNEPVAIIIQGLATPVSAWAAVSRLLTPSLRVYRYDRSGFGLSDPSPLPPTSTNIALELDQLLENADIKPPYILIAHSWGSILSCEFLARRQEGDVVGIVFIEANQERTLEVLDWRPIFQWVSAAKIDFQKVTDIEKRQRLTDEEWKQYQADANDPKNQKQADVESREYAASFPVLAAKKQLHRKPPLLGNYPVSVVKGENGRELRKLYDAAVEKGFGTYEEQIRFREFLSTFDEIDLGLQTELRDLSLRSRFVGASRSGHDVQLTQPEVIVEEVKLIAKYYSHGTSSTHYESGCREFD
jgi:pimeloyl-ACP methyl ester carboxylesterase